MSNTTTTVAIDRETQLIALFNFLIQINSQCLDCFIFIIGNIGAVLTCIVFYQPAFRKSPCAMYFIASSIAQLFIFNCATFIRMIQYGYSVPVNSVPSWFCKIRFYIFYSSTVIARYNIIFASADRYACSSSDVRLRRWSSPKIAFRLIIINIIIWLLFYIQILITIDVKNNKCRINDVTISTYFYLYFLIENGIFPIVLLLFFGFRTIRNIHRSKQRILPNVINERSETMTIPGRLSRKETQLHKMLINQVIIYMILNIPYTVYSVYRTYFGLSSLTGSYALMDTFLNNLFFDLVYLVYALTFLNFILTSNIFRQKFKEIIQIKILRRRIVPTN
ncbi:hypothetical protein I4U23_011064 [Adineta vaga]|nr:hypothetical protein I4U23_011064 [Adineta vaga]